MATVMETINRFKKGDRVEFDSTEKGLVVGFVKSVNKYGLAKVVQDGGKYEWKIGAAKLRPASIPAPQDEPSLMDDWSVTGYKCIGGDETPMYTAKIRRDRKIVGDSMNDGHGGPDSFYFGDKAIEAVFYADVKAWWKQMGGSEDTHEVEALWVDWFVNYKNVGITAKMYVADYNNL